MVKIETFSDKTQALGIQDEVYDVALPVEWCKDFKSVTGFDPRQSFVWIYKDSVTGTPRPLTGEARDALKEYNMRKGTNFSLCSPVLKQDEDNPSLFTTIE